jgi:hypothetical protein
VGEGQLVPRVPLGEMPDCGLRRAADVKRRFACAILS